MAARPRAHHDQSVHPRLQRLLGMAHRDDVVHHNAAPGNGPAWTTSPGARKLVINMGRFVFFAHLHVVIEPVIAGVNDLVDRVRRDAPQRFGKHRRRELFGELRKPVIELFLWVAR